MDREGAGAGSRAEDDEDGQLFDVGLVREYLGYVVRAVRRHKWLAIGVFGAIVSTTGGVLLTLPETYHVETKLLAQRDAGVGARNPYAADPLRGAADVVMSHENLVALVTHLDLVNWWRGHRAPIQKAKDVVIGLLGRELTDQEQAQALVGLLETRLVVQPGDGTVLMTIDWPEGVMAARLLDTAQQNFLEQRHVMEISTIAESVSILEEHATKLRKEIEEQIGKASDAADPAAPPTPAAAEAVAPTPQAPRAAPPKRSSEAEAELARKKVMIEAKQRAVTDLEDFRQRRLLELQASLAEQRSKFTDAHPIILGIQQNIAATSRESPQVVALRAEIKSLQSEYDRAMAEGSSGGGSPARGAAPAANAALPAGVVSYLQAPRDARDPGLEAQLNYALSKYAEIRAQISTARIDLDLAQASFRYRYTVVVPAEPSLKPTKPKIPAILGAAAVGALGLGLLAAVLAEVRSGRIVNRWQVERLLKVPVLAELRARNDPGPKAP